MSSGTPRRPRKGMHPLLMLGHWSGMDHGAVMDWLQGRGWVSDLCVTVWDIAVVDVRRVLEAARATRPLIARALESATPLAERCARPHYRAPGKDTEDGRNWPLWDGRWPKYLEAWDVRDSVMGSEPDGRRQGLARTDTPPRPAPAQPPKPTPAPPVPVLSGREYTW